MPKKSAKKPTTKVAKRFPVANKKPVVKPELPISKPITATPIDGAKSLHKCPRLTIYIYWFIIVSFVCATFYIVGRGHEFLLKRGGSEITMSAQGSSMLESGKAKLLSGDVKGAIVDMTAAIKTDPTAAVVYNYRGEAYLSDANYAAAQADFDKAIELDPESSLAFYDRALLKIQMSNLEEALADLNIALDVFGKRPNEVLAARDIYSKRAQLNLWMKNWETAISDYSAALSQSPSDPSDEDFAGRADAYTATGNYEAALVDYMSAITTISGTIKNNENAAKRISMSRRAMSYFEKSAALHVQIKDMAAAKSDLEAANTLAAALGDTDTQKRILDLLAGLNNQTENPAPATQPAPAPEPAPVVEQPAPEPTPMVEQPAPEPAPVEQPVPTEQPA